MLWLVLCVWLSVWYIFSNVLNYFDLLTFVLYITEGFLFIIVT